MKKRNLSMPKKLAAALATAAFASAAFALVVAPASAQAMETDEVLAQIEEAETADTSAWLILRSDFEGNVLTNFFLSASAVKSCYFPTLMAEEPNADANEASYTVDLSGKDIRLGMGSKISFLGSGKAKVGYKFVGYNDVHYSDQMLNSDKSITPEMELPTGSFKVEGVTYKKGEIVVNLQPVITDAYRAVERAIDDICEVEYTQECSDNIDAAFAGYQALPDWEKPMVDNLDTLYAANRAYFNLKVAANS